MATDKFYLYGKHALTEALLARPSIIQKVFLSKEMEADTELTALLKQHVIAVSSMKGDVKKDVGSDAVHQGVIAVINQDKLYSTMDEALAHAAKKKNASMIHTMSARSSGLRWHLVRVQYFSRSITKHRSPVSSSRPQLVWYFVFLLYSSVT
jgi:hypothetical protein